MKKYGIISIVIVSIIIALINYSSIAKAGAINGIKLAEGVIIPALLPILILTNIIIKSKCSKIFEKLLGWLAISLFKLPKCTAPAILFGLIGGYPAGAILTNDMYRQGLIDEETTKRIMRFNFSGGVAFIVTAVGQITYSSLKIGILLYLSCILPAIVIGIINGLIVKETQKSSKVLYNPLSLNEALVEGVETATKSILVISAYIILFSAICAVLPIPSFLTPIIEITNGLCNSNTVSLDFVAFFLAFGGFCIHFQLTNYLPSYFDFLIFRIINSILSYILVRIWLLAFPIEQSVFSNQSSITPKLTQVNTGFGIIMIIGCAVLILDIENKKLKLR